MDVGASLPVFMTEQGVCGRLKACSAEAVTLPSNDPQLTEGDQVQTNTGGRLS